MPDYSKMNDTVLNLSILADLTDSRETVFFLGSGASRESGLPTAIELNQMVLDSLCYKVPTLINLSNTSQEMLYRIRMEVCIEFCLRVIEMKDLTWMRIFELGEPGYLHYAIATLIMRGDISPNVVTTNFDRLLEKAFHQVSLDYHLNADGKYTSPGNLSVLFKVHGSIDDKESIVALFGEEFFGLKKSRSQCLRKLTKNKSVIFIGYSLADPDIKPVLKEGIVKNFYCISPSSNDGATYSKVLGMRYRGRFNITGKEAGVFLLELRGQKKPQMVSNIQGEIEHAFRSWARQLSVSEKYQIVGHILEYLGQMNEAVLCFKRALRYNRNPNKRARIWETLAITYASRENWSMSRRYFQKIRRSDDTIVSVCSKTDALSGIIYSYVGEKNGKKARYHLSLLMEELESSSKSKDRLFSFFLAMETALLYLHAFLEAPDDERFMLNSINAAATLARKMKATESYAKLLSMLANYYDTRKSDYTKAFNTYKRVLRLYEEMGDELSFAQILNSISGIFFKRMKYKRAIYFALVAQAIFEKYGNNESQAMCWHNISLAYAKMDNEKEKLEAEKKYKYILSQSFADETDKLIKAIAAELGKYGGNVSIQKVNENQ